MQCNCQNLKNALCVNFSEYFRVVFQKNVLRYLYSSASELIL